MHAVDIREEVKRYLNSLGLHPSHTLREGEEGRGSSPGHPMHRADLEGMTRERHASRAPPAYLGGEGRESRSADVRWTASRRSAISTRGGEARGGAFPNPLMCFIKNFFLIDYDLSLD